MPCRFLFKGSFAGARAASWLSGAPAGLDLTAQDNSSPFSELENSFFPVPSYALRNDHINPYQGVVVELMKADESRYRMGDPSLNPTAGSVSPGATARGYDRRRPSA
jgi:hypothetical protein